MVSRGRRWGSARFWGTCAAVYLVAAVAATWPAVGRIGEDLPGDGHDAYLFAWNLSHVQRVLTGQEERLYFTRVLYHPVGASLHFHTLSLSHGLLAFPMLQVGLDPSRTYGLLWLLSFPLSGLAAGFLAWSVTRSRAGGFVAGLAFSLSSFRMAHGMGHLNLLGTQWLVLAMALVVRAFPPEGTALARGRCRAVLAGLALAVAVLTSWYFLVYLALFLPMYLGWITLRSRQWPDHRALFLLVGTAGLGLAPAAWPLLVRLLSGDGSYYASAEMAFRADLAGFLLPGRFQTLLGPLSDALTHGRGAFRGFEVEGCVSLGWTVLALAVLGRRQTFRFWPVAGLCFLLLALGPRLSVLGRDVPLPLPQALLMRIPVLKGARIPARFVLMTHACLIPLVAAGTARLLNGRSGPARRWLLAGLSVLLLLELAAVPYPVSDARVPPGIRRMARDPAPGAVLVAPELDSYRHLYLQHFHQRPLVGGRLARRTPEESRRFGTILQELSRPFVAESPSEGRVLPDLLRRHEIRYLLLQEDLLARQANAETRRQAEAILRAAFPGGPAWRDERIRYYRVEPRSAGATPERKAARPTAGTRSFADLTSLAPAQ